VSSPPVGRDSRVGRWAVVRLIGVLALPLVSVVQAAAALPSGPTPLPGSSSQGGDADHDDAVPSIDWQALQAAGRVVHSVDPDEGDSAFAGGTEADERVGGISGPSREASTPVRTTPSMPGRRSTNPGRTPSSTWVSRARRPTSIATKPPRRTPSRAPTGASRANGWIAWNAAVRPRAVTAATARFSRASGGQRRRWILRLQCHP
jgi:hypothetical protein